MLVKILIFLLLPMLMLHIFLSESQAACDCGSTDANSPCTGQTIFVSVTAGTPNGGTAVNSEYTWRFNSGGGDAYCGQFANGDFWIAPAPGQSSVTITSITSNGFVSADVNPNTESMGLLSGAKNYGNYNAGENIIPTLPQSYATTTSIVAAIQRNEAVEGKCGTASIVGECTDSYDVLTVLPSVPENAGATVIRPNITGETKNLITFSDLDFSRIPSKTYLTGTTSTGLENIRRRWSHSTEIFGLLNGISGGYSEGGRAFRSHTLIDDYGAGVAVAWYNDLMVLFSDDHTIEEKKPALTAMFAYGLDLYHAMYDAPTGVTRQWGTGATQHPGKFLPPVLLAALMKDSRYANTLKTVSSHIRDYIGNGPLELAQIHSGVNGPVWGDDSDLSGVNYQGSYWVNLRSSQCYDEATGTCKTAIGPKNMLDPYGYIDGPPNRPGSGYMGTSLGVQRSMVATMFLIPEICEIINYDALVEYVDRTGNHGIMASNDPCVTPDSRETANCDPYRNKDCTYYGVTWGPITPSDKHSQCITTPTPPYTKVGRFTKMDGVAVSAGYTSTQVEKNWTTIRGTNTNCHVSVLPAPNTTIPAGFKLSQ